MSGNGTSGGASNACDSTCVGLAVSLGLLFFIIGCLLLWYFKDQIAPEKEVAGEKPAQDATNSKEIPDVEAGQIMDPAAPIEIKSDGSTSMKRKRTSNNEQVINISAIPGTVRSDNSVPVIFRPSSTEPNKKKHTSNNEQVIDLGDPNRMRRRGSRSNNENFVDACDVVTTSPAHSANEPAVDGNNVKDGSGKANGLRGRRTSSNNERAVDVFEIRKGPPPTEAELEAARKRAASLERRLEEVSKTHSALTETARKLQSDIAELSAQNHEMRLDN